MGAGVFHGRVRDGIGCRHPAIATRSSNPEKGLGEVLVCCVLFGSFRAIALDVHLCLHPGFHRIGRCVVGSLSLSGD